MKEVKYLNPQPEEISEDYVGGQISDDLEFPNIPTIPTINKEDDEITTEVDALDVDSGLTSSEQGDSVAQQIYNDPNEIKVTIADSKTPLVILFGPPSCGKTMTLIRMTRFLKSKGYTIEPIRSFRPTNDDNYTKMCDNFDKMINSDDAAKSTAHVNFMLVRVLYQGKALCQILEGPGELYFDPNNPKADNPAYMNTIINCPNRKIWLIMLEPDGTGNFMDTEVRANYVDKIHKLKTQIDVRDKVVFVFNKVDKTSYVINPGKIVYGSVLKAAQDLYPNIFEPFKNENPITRWFSPNNFDFVPFQTGNFTSTSRGTLTFQPGNSVHPQRLWNVLQKRIKGGWL